MKNGTPKPRVTSYHLTADNVILQVKDGNNEYRHTISRKVFEIWLTDGTDVVDLGFTHSANNVITEVPVQVAIDQYWEEGESLDNTPILEHLTQFLACDEGRKPVSTAA